MSKCNICNNEFESQLKDDLTPEEINSFRESLNCKKCNSISRDRIMMWALANCMNHKECLLELPTNKEIRILESTGVRGHPNVLNSKFDYINTKFDSNSIRKKLDRRKFADFQDLHFDNEFFDYIVSSDVFEHVRLDDKAFREVYRTLKNHGYFLMTAPFSYKLNETLIRVKPIGDSDIFLLPPEYHAENTLAYRVYGSDIFQKLNSYGFNVCYLNIQISDYAISQQEIFVCRKNSAPYISVNNSNIKIVRKEEFYIN